jgi:hypothetical protein
MDCTAEAIATPLPDDGEPIVIVNQDIQQNEVDRAAPLPSAPLLSDEEPMGVPSKEQETALEFALAPSESSVTLEDEIESKPEPDDVAENEALPITPLEESSSSPPTEIDGVLEAAARPDERVDRIEDATEDTNKGAPITDIIHVIDPAEIPEEEDDPPAFPVEEGEYDDDSQIFVVATPKPVVDSVENEKETKAVENIEEDHEAETDTASAVSTPVGWAKAQAEDCSQPWVYRMNLSASSIDSKDLPDSKLGQQTTDLSTDNVQAYEDDSSSTVSCLPASAAVLAHPDSLEGIAEASGEESTVVSNGEHYDVEDPEMSVDYDAELKRLLGEDDLDITFELTDEEDSSDPATLDESELGISLLLPVSEARDEKPNGPHGSFLKAACIPENVNVDSGIDDKKANPNTSFWRQRKVQYSILGCVLLVVGVSVGVIVATGGSGRVTVYTTTAPSMSPSAAPSSFDLDKFDDILPDFSLASLSNQNSPAAKAFSWLTSEQDLYAYSDFQKLQRFVLATLFYSTNGEKWLDNGGWVEKFRFDECDWYMGEDSDSGCVDGRYEEITLDLNGLAGTLPDELSVLTDLKVLRMSFNGLTGEIPSRFGSLTNLKILSLYINRLKGPLPLELGSLSALEDIDLSRNFLSGEIPIEVISGWKQVKIVGLSGNRFSGALPTELGLMSNIEYLDVSRNGLKGPIPSEIGNLGNLETLYLSNNSFLTGQIPSTFGLLSGLRFLKLGNTNLRGTVPAEVCALKQKNDLVIEVDCSKIQCGCDCSCV